MAEVVKLEYKREKSKKNTGPLWGLLDLLKRRCEKRQTFTGPPHLQKSVCNISETMRKDFELECDAIAWQASICCECACESFRIRYFGKLVSGSLADLEIGMQTAVINCSDCNNKLLLFDPTLHGYDAAICNTWAMRPAEQVPDTLLHCHCGSELFRIVVTAMYDTAPEDLDDIPPQQWNDSYGWFSAHIKCENCGQLSKFIDYECA